LRFKQLSVSGRSVTGISAPSSATQSSSWAAFRAIAERVRHREPVCIRRRHEDWQREVSRNLARGERTVELFHRHDAIHFADLPERAKDELIRYWL
jgi:hypothetical protein